MVYDCDILTCTFACFARVENRYPPGSGAIINRSWSRSVYDCDAFGTSGNMAPVAFYSRISTNQLSTNQFFRLPAYHKERDISCSLLVPPIVVSKRNRRQERTAGTNGSRHETHQGRSHLLCHSFPLQVLRHHLRRIRKSSTPSTTQCS